MQRRRARHERVKKQTSRYAGRNISVTFLPLTYALFHTRVLYPST